jgi:hypothetical protein
MELYGYPFAVLISVVLLKHSRVVLVRAKAIDQAEFIAGDQVDQLTSQETLLRGSELPQTVLQAELLRATDSERETPPAQLLRALTGERETRNLLRVNKWYNRVKRSNKRILICGAERCTS